MRFWKVKLKQIETLEEKVFIVVSDTVSTAEALVMNSLPDPEKYIAFYVDLITEEKNDSKIIIAENHACRNEKEHEWSSDHPRHCLKCLTFEAPIIYCGNEWHVKYEDYKKLLTENLSLRTALQANKTVRRDIT